MATQLRRYRIEQGKLDRFVEDWLAGVVPLRERFGFTIHGAWALPESSEFVWIIEHDDLDAADRAYYESDERRRLAPDPAVHIDEAIEAPAHRII